MGIWDEADVMQETADKALWYAFRAIAILTVLEPSDFLECTM